MKRVKVYIPVILQIINENEEIFKLEILDNEFDIIETDAINSYISGDYQELENGE